MSLPKTSRALKITMEPHRRHDAATDSCCCSGIHAGRRRRASSGANFAQSGTSPARTRCAMSIAFGQCAHPLRRQAHCQGLARTRWTVRPQSVPNRASGKNRGVFPDFDNLRVEQVWRASPRQAVTAAKSENVTNQNIKSRKRKEPTRDARSMIMIT